MLFWGILTATAVSLFSCAKVEPVIETAEPENNGVPFEIRILGDETKTTNSSMSTLWAASDAVNLFHASSTSGPYTSDGEFTTTTAGANVTFTGTLAEALSSGSYYWYAIYPYNSSITKPNNTGTKGYVTVGSAKTGVQSQSGVSNMNHIAGPNYPLAGVSAATAYDAIPAFSLSHLTTLMAVEVTNDSGNDITITSVSLYSESEDIVGTYFIDFTGATPVFTKSGDSYVGNTATLSVSSGNIADGETETFYLAVKPFTAVAGDDLTLSVTTAEFGEQVSTKKPAANKTFLAGKKNTLRLNYTNSTPITLPEVDNSSTPYKVGFEAAEGFTATSSYNNVVEKQDGAADREWNILSGSVSTTGAMVGANSMLMRDYSANGFAPYVSTAFKLKSLKYVTFKAKTKKLGYDLQLYYSTDEGISWTAGDSFTLSTTAQVYSTTFATTLSGAAIKFAIKQPGSRTDNQDVWIDDVEFHSTVPSASVTPATSAASAYENTADGTTATLNGTFTLNYGAVIGDVTAYGFKYKIGDGDFTTVAGTIASTAINVVTISKAVTGLTKDTEVTYYAYVEYGGNTYNGETSKFTPTKSSVPTKTATFTFATYGYTNGQAVASVTTDDDSHTDISLAFAQNGGSNPSKYYDTGTGIRMYGNNQLTVNAGSKTIKAIAFTFDGTYTGTLGCGEVGTYTTGSWSGSAHSVVFTNNGSTNRIKVIVVTYID